MISGGVLMARTNTATTTHIEIKRIKEFAKSNPDEAKSKARQILIKTGVLTKTGKKKDTIVSWE